MSVVGYWTDEEIKASYTPSDTGIVICIGIAVLGFLTIIAFAKHRKKELLLTCFAAIACASAYVLLTQVLARALSVESPLHVKVHGLLTVPFFFATRDLGLLLVLVLFGAVNFFTFGITRRYMSAIVAAFTVNIGLTAILSSASILAYVAIGLGVGLPTN